MISTDGINVLDRAFGHVVKAIPYDLGAQRHEPLCIAKIETG
jgi:hypothetical protein